MLMSYSTSVPKVLDQHLAAPEKDVKAAAPPPDATAQ